MPFEDWKFFKAQSIAESGLDPNALSYCGARGLMQLMPATAKELGVNNPWDPEESIQGGIRYDRRLYDYWRDIPQHSERKKIMFSSYNSGMGNISKARNLAQSNEWDLIAKALPKITGKHSDETIGYVKRIYTLKKNLN